MQLDSEAASDVQLDNEAEHEAEQPGHRPYARGASGPQAVRPRRVRASDRLHGRDARDGRAQCMELSAGECRRAYPSAPTTERLLCVCVMPGRSHALRWHRVEVS